MRGQESDGDGGARERMRGRPKLSMFLYSTNKWICLLYIFLITGILID